MGGPIDQDRPLAAPGSPPRPIPRPVPWTGRRIETYLVVLAEMAICVTRLADDPSTLERRLSLFGLGFGPAVLVFLLTERWAATTVRGLSSRRAQAGWIAAWVLLLLALGLAPVALLGF